MNKAASAFNRFAKAAARATGRPAAFVVAFLIIVVWGVTGPMFGYSDTWQLIINTGTTIVTFLMVFLIQNTQNRDTEAVQVKLDELIRAMKGASNELINLEELDDDELEQVHARYAKLADHARAHVQRRRGGAGHRGHRSHRRPHRAGSGAHRAGNGGGHRASSGSPHPDGGASDPGTGPGQGDGGHGEAGASRRRP